MCNIAYISTKIIQYQLSILNLMVEILIDNETRLSKLEQENITLKTELAVQKQINTYQETHLKSLDSELVNLF